jgi:hypothetical protein
MTVASSFLMFDGLLFGGSTVDSFVMQSTKTYIVSGRELRVSDWKEELRSNECTAMEFFRRLEDNYAKPQSGYLVAWPKFTSDKRKCLETSEGKTWWHFLVYFLFCSLVEIF